jgi:hypothetical protein
MQDTAAGEAVSPAVGTYSHAFAGAVLALLPRQQQEEQQEQQPQDAAQQNGHHHPSRAAAEAALAGSGLPELLLMSHHPAITAGVAKQLTAWQVAVKRLGGVVPTALKGEMCSGACDVWFCMQWQVEVRGDQGAGRCVQAALEGKMESREFQGLSQGVTLKQLIVILPSRTCIHVSWWRVCSWCGSVTMVANQPTIVAEPQQGHTFGHDTHVDWALLSEGWCKYKLQANHVVLCTLCGLG